MANKKFKTKMKRLETIAGNLENGDLELESAMASFEEGMKLIAECQKDLDQAEARVMVLTEGGQRTLEEELEDE